MKFIYILFFKLLYITVAVAQFTPGCGAGFCGIAASSGGSSFNGGKVQANLNFAAIGGDYPFINFQKNQATPSRFGNNTGFASPTDVDANGYLVSGSNAEANGGLYDILRIPSAASNGIYYVRLTTGKGTLSTISGTSVVTTTACAITTGSSTTLSCTPGAGPFTGGVQDFRSGMEVPISGTTGVTVTNGPGGSITANVFTVCPGYVVGANTFGLCLNDQTTPVATTGTPGGTTTVSYGRLAIGVAVKGRVVIAVSGSPVSLSPVGIVSQNASTPITDLALVTQGSEEVRYESGCDACIFSATFLAKLQNSSNIGVLRSLNSINQNASLEVNWADRKPTTYISYGSDMFDRTPSVYASGGTTNFGNDYSLTFGSGGPAGGQQIVLRFNASSTVTASTVTMTNGSPTINWTSNGLSVGDPVACTNLPPPIYNAGTYYVTTAATNSIEVAWTPGGTPITFTANSSGTTSCVRQPTLNLNGTGAVPIKDQFGGGIVLNSSTRQISAGVIGTLTYDSVLRAWLKFGADVSGGDQYFTSGWPPEIFLRLCRVIGAHPWFIPPRFVVDVNGGISNYMPSLATYVAANQSSWMIPRYEIINNELWNNGFPSTQLGTGHARVYANSALTGLGYAGWTTGDLANYAGKIGSVVGQAINQSYGGIPVDGTRYQAIIGVQTGAFNSTGGISTNAPRMTSADYVAQTPPAQTGYTKSAASNWSTHITNSLYVRPGLYGTSLETTLATSYGGGWIVGSISGNQLTVTSVTVGTNPVPIGTAITGPGIPAGTSVASGSSSPYTLNNTLSSPVGSTSISTVSPTADLTAPKTYIDTLNYTSSFTGSISGTVLTVTSVASGTILPTHVILGSGITPNTIINSNGTGSGGTGTYNLNQSMTIGSISIQSAGQISVPVLNVAFANIKSYADTYSKACISYEGGYDAIYTSAGASSLDQLRYAGKITTNTSNAAQGIQTYIASNLANYKANGCSFPSLFQLTGITPSNNVWSAIEDIYQTTSDPVWDAYTNYN